MEVGDGEGASEGVTEGEGVGSGVGASTGVNVGTGVGGKEGLEVGKGLGRRVGTGIGACVGGVEGAGVGNGEGQPLPKTMPSMAMSERWLLPVVPSHRKATCRCKKIERVKNEEGNYKFGTVIARAASTSVKS